MNLSVTFKTTAFSISANILDVEIFSPSIDTLYQILLVSFNVFKLLQKKLLDPASNGESAILKFAEQKT